MLTYPPVMRKCIIPIRAAPRAPVTCPCEDMLGPPTKILNRKHQPPSSDSCF